jgi:hypothetical protein
MNDLNLMTPEELQEHIQKCQAILEAKQNEKVNQFIGNLASEAYRLLQERPWAKVKAKYYDEEREENIDIEIDLDYLTYEDNYIV